jgi:AmmeMemoRadiSam system protein B
MAILGAVMVPHPPLIIPAVGRGGEAQIEETTRAYVKVAESIAAWKPDTVVIITPHSVMYQNYIHISPGVGAKGDFGRFGAHHAKYEVTYDKALVYEIEKLASANEIAAGTLGERQPALDHGFLVPLHFLIHSMSNPLPCEFVRIGLSGLSFETHYRLGMLISDAAEKLSRMVCIVASGDLSHYVQADGPYGFRPEGPEYDSKIMDIMGRAAFDELLAMPEDFCEKAGECGQRSFLIMAGAFDGTKVEADMLSYQGITGVGYGVGIFTPIEPDKSRHFINKQE